MRGTPIATESSRPGTRQHWAHMGRYMPYLSAVFASLTESRLDTNWMAQMIDCREKSFPPTADDLVPSNPRRWDREMDEDENK